MQEIQLTDEEKWIECAEATRRALCGLEAWDYLASSNHSQSVKTIIACNCRRQRNPHDFDLGRRWAPLPDLSYSGLEGDALETSWWPSALFVCSAVLFLLLLHAMRCTIDECLSSLCRIIAFHPTLHTLHLDAIECNHADIKRWIGKVLLQSSSLQSLSQTLFYRAFGVSPQ